MSFESPGWLFGLLAALIPLVLGFLRLPPRRLRVPSLFIWRELRERTPPMREMRRPRLNASLILSALALACGALALSAPSILSAAPEPRHLILVIDTAPRMLTRHPDGRTSFDHASAAALTQVGALEPPDRVHLIAEASPPRDLSRDAALEAIRRLKAGRAPGDLSPLLAAARRLAALHPSSRTVVATDRAVPGFTTWRTGAATSDNVGIAGLAIDADSIFVRLANAGPARTVKITIAGAAEEIQAPPGDSALVRPRKDPASAVEVKIVGADNFGLDDVARSTRLPGRDVLEVSYRGRKREDLLRVLTLLPGVRVSESADGPADVWVVCEAVPEPDRPAVLIAVAPPAGEVGPFRVGDLIPADKIGLKTDHPVIREIAYAEAVIRPRTPREVSIPEGAQALIVADGRPILALHEDSKGLTAVMAFDPFADRWSKHSSFAVFFAALFEHARRRLGGQPDRILKAGEPADFSSCPGLALVEGEEVTLTGGVLSRAAVGPARLRSDLGPLEAHFNLLDGESSMNAGEWDPPLEPLFARETTRTGRPRPLGSTLLVLCILLVIAGTALERQAGGP